jgi:hypothetical protein
VINQETTATFADKDQIAKSIMQVIRNSESGALVPGEKQCRYCKAALHGTCPTVLEEVKKIAALAGESLAVIEEKEDAEIAKILEMLSIADTIGKRYSAEMMRRIAERGTAVAGYDVKRTSGGRKITDIVEAFGLLGGAITQEEFFQCNSVSVTQLEAKFCEKLKASGEVKTLKEGKNVFAERLQSVLQENPQKVSLVCTK